MDTRQRGHRGTSAARALDGFAIVKGWLATLGLWLGFTLVLAVFAEAGWVEESLAAYDGYLWVWSIFAGISILVAIFVGLPLAVLLDLVLRRVQVPWVHVVAFLVVFALLPGIGLWSAVGSMALFWFSTLLGVCAAAGRALAFRRRGRYRRPTTWA